MVAYKGEIITFDEDSVITCLATVNISGGMLASTASGSWSAATTVTGTRAAYTTSAIGVDVVPSGTLKPVGIALTDAASGSYVAVARKALVILPNNGAACTVGNMVGAAAAAASSNACCGSVGTLGAIGTSFNASASGGYAIVSLNI